MHAGTTPTLPQKPKSAPVAQGSAFEEVARELTRLLDAKDPRMTRAPRGSVLLLFPGAGLNGRTETLTVRIGEKRVEVLRGAASVPGLPVAMMRAKIEDFAAHCATPNTRTLSRLEIYGDLALFGAVATLAQAHRSAVSARFFTTSPKSKVA